MKSQLRKAYPRLDTSKGKEQGRETQCNNQNTKKNTYFLNRTAILSSQLVQHSYNDYNSRDIRESGTGLRVTGSLRGMCENQVG